MTSVTGRLYRRGRSAGRARRLPVGIRLTTATGISRSSPVFAQLDFVLNTMIMGVGADGKPRRLWLPDMTSTTRA